MYRIIAAAVFLATSFYASTAKADFSTAYTIEHIGLSDAAHKRDTDGYLFSSIDAFNQAGQAIGSSRRFGSGGAYLGQDAWFYNGSTTVSIGLTGVMHTRNTDGYVFNLAKIITQAGQVVGGTSRYGSGGEALGGSAWVYDGNNTVAIGLTDAIHTRSDGYKASRVNGISDAGQVAGSSDRYNAGALWGRSAWIYDGNGTVNIGLTDAEHTRALISTDYQYNTVAHHNQAGQVLGIANRYNSAGLGWGQSAWIYDDNSTINIGLTDAEHTRDNGEQISSVSRLNEAGHAAGSAGRYNGGALLGLSAWVYIGGSTTKIGLTDAEHTRDTDGFQANHISALNEAGQVAGHANRYGSDGVYLSGSAWVYNGGITTKIGLTGAEHTRDTDGYQLSAVTALNEAGQAAGYANRYGSDGVYLGRSVWVHNGGSTTKVGLTGAEHTRDTDGFQGNYAFVALNEAGQAAGYANRYGSGGADLGQSAWAFSGNNTVKIGLTGAEHTRDTDGYQHSNVTAFNEAGQAAGYSIRYGSDGTNLGQDAWFYDGDESISLGDLSVSSTGDAHSEVNYLTDDGLVLGSYRLDGAPDYMMQVFAYSDEMGLFDLGLAIDESFTDWESLDTSIGITDGGIIFGSASASPSSKLAYLLSPIPEPDFLINIDVDPFSPANEVLPASDNVIIVAVHSTNTADGDAINFDALQVDPSTLRLGPMKAPNIAHPWPVDVGADGDTDVLFGFRTQASGLLCGDTEVRLTGETYAGELFEGNDTIQTSDCDSLGCHPPQ